MSSDSSYTGYSDDGRESTGPIPGLSSDAPMANRGQQRKSRHHLLSVVLSLVLTPVGLALAGIGANRWIDLARDRAEVINGVLPWLGGGAAVLLLVALLSRMSGAGPLLAGLVWGVGPAAGLLLYTSRSLDFVRSLPLGPDRPQDNLLLWGPAAFTCVAGLLVGMGLAGRWKHTTGV